MHIGQQFDASAVEQIANRLTEEERRAFLASLGGVPGEATTPRQKGAPQEVSLLVRHSDPEIQALIEKMWAPYWEHLPPEALTDPRYQLPGRKIAAERRQLRSSPEPDK